MDTVTVESLIQPPTCPHTFISAAESVLQVLYRRLPFNLWMVTRTEGDNWIVLRSEDHGYGVQPGDVFRWSDSFCSRMVQGQGPRIAPRSRSIPAYAEAPIGRLVPIEAYVGVPLTFPDGSLFGTLCALHPATQPDFIAEELGLIELLASMLSGLLHNELAVTEAVRLVERAQADAETDPLTEIHNRRAWDRLLAAEESRCRQYGHPASVLSIDIDGLKTVNDLYGHSAGDDLIRRAAKGIRTSIRKSDVVARVGGDEFAVLVTDANLDSGREAVSRILTELDLLAVSASVGVAPRYPAKGLESAWQEADLAMYVEKRKNSTPRVSLRGMPMLTAGPAPNITR